MIKSGRFTCIVLLVVLAGCASAYKQKSLTGGFQEEWLGSTKFRVFFYHNGYTSEADADALVWRRAAELALENGFRYVRADSEDSKHPFIGKGWRHILDVSLFDEPTEGARDAVDLIRESESAANGRLSDRARLRLMEIQRQGEGGG